MHIFSNILKIGIFSLLCAISWHAQAKWETRNYSTMGTNIVIELHHPNDATRKLAMETVVNEMERINQTMSTYIDSSDISTINRLAFSQEVPVSKEIYDLLALSAHISSLTDGAFDITYASVGYLYSYPNKTKPTNEQINILLEAVNYKLVILNEANTSVRFLHKDVKIDLGGIAKGYAVDNAIELLSELGISHALVTAGGDTRLLGDRLGKPWIVGIRDPRNRDKQAVVIPLAQSAMSTSGDYERYFEEDGKRFHHILSPKTGKSIYEVQSVSIIGPQSVYNDALSTAVFVMGLEKGIGLINALPEFEAIVMDANRRMHYSDGLAQ
ncbi:MAG: thiamine biosynthesis lipoprotein [Alphaproteobacteria bacterium]|jgi:thiamine biosynthesis lipoprotein